MKILTVVYSLEKGGTQRAAQNFAEGYIVNGHDSRLLVTKHDGLRRSELADAGVSVWLYISDAVLSEICEWQPDCIHIHSHGLALKEVVDVLDCAKLAKVIETNVFSVPSPWVNLVDNSYQLSEWCQWLYNKRAKELLRSEIVPYPVRIGAFSRAHDIEILRFRAKFGIKQSDILIGRIGQAFDGKWSPLLIITYNRLKKINSNFRLVLVNPPESIKLLALSSDFKESIVVIDSILGDDKLAIAYSAIDIFVLAADQGESFGMVLAEAMLCETPVVAFSTPWADNSQCEVVGNKKGGFITITAKGFQLAILELANNPDMRKDMGIMGRKKIIAEYDHIKVAALSIEKIKSSRSFKLSEGVPNVYFDAFDKPNFASLVLLQNGLYLDLLRYLTGYQPWTLFLKRLRKKFMRAIFRSLFIKKA